MLRGDLLAVAGYGGASRTSIVGGTRQIGSPRDGGDDRRIEGWEWHSVCLPQFGGAGSGLSVPGFFWGLLLILLLGSYLE